jgi:cyclophilin family peptidyl-prolyl cis-trans isomerase
MYGAAFFCHTAGRRLGARLTLLACLLCLPFAAAAEHPVASFDTVLGAFDVELCQEISASCEAAAPNTVANFLANVGAGEYDDSVIHDHTASEIQRIIGGFFVAVGSPMTANASLNDSISNEFNQDNTRGTLAMDKVSGQFNSHATRWYVNLADNPTLDMTLGGYTVFGVVLDMTVVDAIAALETCDVRTQSVLVTPVNLKSLWGQMPHVGDLDPCNPPGGSAEPVTDAVQFPDELVIVNSITVPEPAGAVAGLTSLLALLGRAARRGPIAARSRARG